MALRNLLFALLTLAFFGCASSEPAAIGCLYDAECGAGSCVAGACADIVTCGGPSDCGEGTPACSAAAGCVECVADGDCEGRARCLGNRCASNCSSDEDCSEGAHCDPVTRACVQCSSDAECPASLHCRDFRCRVDSCVPGAARCDDELNLLWVCDPDGRRETPLYCPDEYTCAEKDGVAGCQPWVCTPGSTWCDEAGDKVFACPADGLTTDEAADCRAMDGACVEGECLDVICEPGKRECDDDARSILECDATGTKLSVATSCASTYYCDAKDVECRPMTCVPNEVLCDGNFATQCASDGSAPRTDGDDCTEDGGACFDGECRPVVCEADYLCLDGSVHQCTDNGTATILIDDCTYYSTYYHCIDGMSYCSYDVCTQGQPYCSGNIARVCNADGSAPVYEGVECGEDKVCLSGVCTPVVCTANAYFCQDGNVRRCSADGTWSSLWDSCTSGEYCLEGAASCRADLCTNGASYCSGDTAMQCASDGSGPVDAGTACGEQNCYLGTCRDVVCTSSGYNTCVDGHPSYCSENQTAWTRTDTCSNAEHCIEGNYSCTADVCTAGQGVCVGALLSTCEGDGSGPIDAGTACPDGQSCLGGACVPVICTPGAYRCIDGSTTAREVCNPGGTAWVSGTSCTMWSAFSCNPTDGACEPRVCSPSASSCAGEQVALCDASGTGFASLGTDCAANALTCTLTGCQSSAVDGTTTNQATGVTLPSGRFLYGVYFADTPRTLTGLQLVSTLGTSTTLTWRVWQSDSFYGPYTSVASSTTGATSGTVSRNSGTLSVSLQSRKFYLLGVQSPVSMSIQYSTVTTPLPVSFGQYIGLDTQNFSTVPSSFNLSSSLSSLRTNFLVTTVAP